MARKAVVALAVALLALMALAPAAGAQELESPYTGVAPIVEEQPPRIVTPPTEEVEEVAAVVPRPARPADVAEVEVLAVTGFGLSAGVLLSVLLLGAGAGLVLLARRRRAAAT